MLMGFEDFKSLINHPVSGAIWETHVVMQVIKHFQSLGKNRPLFLVPRLCLGTRAEAADPQDSA